MAEEKIKILLAEDDLNLGILLMDFLESEGFEVKLCKNGELALRAFESDAFQFCVLDVMMPVMDGFTLAKKIREKNPQVPILFLTARSMKEDKVKGFESGADDYIIKPFDEVELLYRIKAILRRSGENSSNEPAKSFQIGKFIFDPANQSLTLGKEIKRITSKESAILLFLCKNQNRLVKREELLEAIWGKNDYFLGRSMDVFITKLRKYLKDDPAVSIENVHGVGFLFKTEKLIQR